MSKIYFYDTTLVSSEKFIVRFIKKYNIILDILPQVLENIIIRYIDHIIKIIVYPHKTYDGTIEYTISNIHFICNINMFKINDVTTYGISELVSDCGLTEKYSMYSYPWMSILNYYMHIMYDKNKYFNSHYYNHAYSEMKYITDYHNNELCFYGGSQIYDVKEMLRIKITNHRKFKNMLVIIKCVINYLRKN